MSIVKIDENRFGRTLQRAEESEFASWYNRDIMKLEDDVMRNGRDAERRKGRGRNTRVKKRLFYLGCTEQF